MVRPLTGASPVNPPCPRQPTNFPVPEALHETLPLQPFPHPSFSPDVLSAAADGEFLYRSIYVAVGENTHPLAGSTPPLPFPRVFPGSNQGGTPSETAAISGPKNAPPSEDESSPPPFPASPTKSFKRRKSPSPLLNLATAVDLTPAQLSFFPLCSDCQGSFNQRLPLP